MTIAPVLSILKALPSDRQIRIAQGLRTLSEASLDAFGLHVESHRFAIPCSELRELGLTGHDIRWLLECGIIEKVTPKRGIQRTTVADRTQESCFVLVASHASMVQLWCGKVIVREFRPKRSAKYREALRPRWDHEKKELWLGDIVVKRFRVPAINQILILTSFEELNWLSRIDDPLPKSDSVNRKERLNAAIKKLNRGQKNRLIRFFGDGSGKSICWSLVVLNRTPIGPKSYPDRP